jgi:hypothetical protein
MSPNAGLLSVVMAESLKKWNRLGPTAEEWWENGENKKNPGSFPSPTREPLK